MCNPAIKTVFNNFAKYFLYSSTLLKVMTSSIFLSKIKGRLLVIHVNWLQDKQPKYGFQGFTQVWGMFFSLVIFTAGKQLCYSLYGYYLAQHSCSVIASLRQRAKDRVIRDETFLLGTRPRHSPCFQIHVFSFLKVKNMLMCTKFCWKKHRACK